MAGIEVIGVPQSIKQRAVITIMQDGSHATGARGYMPFAGDIVACGFFNDNGGGAFTACAHVDDDGGVVASSNATLGLLTSERVTTLTNNIGLAKGANIYITSGTRVAGAPGPTVALVEIEGKLSNIV